MKRPEKLIWNSRHELYYNSSLLFGKNPQLFFPRAFIRFIRYDGIEAKVGLLPESKACGVPEGFWICEGIW
jgi:predicted HTH transcriptional regulator